MEGISVVVPTYNMRPLLSRTLESLSAQTLDQASYEVIVVDDGSDDGSAELVRVFSSRMRLQYHFQEDRGYRVAKARNTGIAHAAYPVVLFLDSGMLVSARTLELHRNMHAGRDPLAVIALSYGVAEYDCCQHGALLERIVVEHGLDKALPILECVPPLHDCRCSYVRSIEHRLEKLTVPWILFWTGHVSVTKTSLQSIGGFDEWFTRWGGEDVELGLRLMRAGCEFRLLPSVESIHWPHRKDPQQKKRDSRHNVAYIHRKHELPETALLQRCSWQQIVSEYTLPVAGTIQRRALAFT